MKKNISISAIIAIAVWCVSYTAGAQAVAFPGIKVPVGLTLPLKRKPSQTPIS